MFEKKEGSQNWSHEQTWSSKKNVAGQFMITTERIDITIDLTINNLKEHKPRRVNKTP